jgi:opacity protein-like surface antigen
MLRLLRVIIVSAIVASCIAAPRPASAQEVGTMPVPLVEVMAGYTFMRDFTESRDISPDFPKHVDFPAGWAFSTAVNPTQWLGLVGEVTGSYKNDLNLTFDELAVSNKARVYTFMGGPRFFKKVGRVAPFGQVLAGVAHMRLESTLPEVPEFGTFSEDATNFAFQPGGGVTIFLTENVGVRLAADYRCIIDHTDDGNDYANEFRFLSGFTFNWGAR